MQAANWIDPDWPRSRINTSAATKHATPDPSVLAKYNPPTELPIFCDERTKCSTRSGKVAPMSSVGTMINEKAASPVVDGELLAVNSAIQRNSLSDPTPNAAVPNSAIANNTTSGRRAFLESAPPAKLPNPRPSMNALTTIVTDWMFRPYMANSARCQTI